MCGICGILGHYNESVLRNMNQAMIHRGPDSEGYYWGEHCGLGIRRLKIIDPAGSEQPIFNEDQSLVLVCNGEIYNYRALRQVLEDRGHRFSTSGDVETIIHLYEEYREDCVSYLHGMFAFALWDVKHRKLFLARDRLGIKPLYWARFPNRTLFASEIRALHASGEVKPELDEASIIRFTGFPAIPAPLSIFRQVKSLPPGHTLSIDSSGIKFREYWDVDFIKATNRLLPEEEATEQLLQVLSEAVSMRLISDVPLGAFLSGGIDSSAVVALMAQRMNHPVRTFSIRFTGDAKEFAWFDDASYATKVAQALGTDHTEEVITGNDVLDNLAESIWAMDQPSGDAIQYYLVSKSARKDVTVALSGTGGDEVFAGYEWFKEIRWMESVHHHFRWLKPEVAQKILHAMRWIPRSYQLPRFWHRIETILIGRNGFGERYRLNRRLYRGEDLFYVFSPHFIARIIDYPLDIEDHIDKFCTRCEGLDPVARTSYLQIKTDMADLLVRDQDAVSMAQSLEVRLPMIDHKVVELASRIPSDLKLRGNQEKFILRKIMSPFLPPDIVNRPKKGFIFPMDHWMRNELRPIVLSCMSREATLRRGIFSLETTQQLKNDFFKGKQPFFKIWNQVVFELWCRIVIDRQNGWQKPSEHVKDFL